MRKFYAFAALALVVLGCQKSELEVDNNPELVEREIAAYGSILTDAADSKAYVDDNWGIYWSANQYLSAWATDGTNATSLSVFYSSNEGGESTTQFKSWVPGNSFRFVHPYSNKTITDGKFIFSIASQSVDMNTPKSHLTDNIYMMSDVVEVVDDIIESFEMKQVSSILNLNIKFDGILGSSRAQVTEVEIDGMPLSSTLNMNSGIAIEDCLGDVTSETLIASISNAAEVSDGETIAIPLSVLPGKVEGEITAVITYFIGTQRNILTKSFTPTDMEFVRGSYHDLTLICNNDCDIQSLYPLEGEGTSASPYLLSSKQDLLMLADYINNGVALYIKQTTAVSSASSITKSSSSDDTQLYFKLTQDIDIEGSVSDQWTPIGTYNLIAGNYYTEGYSFNFHLDGNNHTISGIYIDNEFDNQGLFGCVGEDGVVDRLTVDGIVSGSNYLGSIVAFNFGTISNCVNNASVVSSGDYVGGVVGYNRYGTITNCYNALSVYGSSDVGGVAGYNYYGIITNSYNKGYVYGTGDNIAGLVGSNYYGEITDCFNIEYVNGISLVGGVSGYSYYGTITACRNFSSVSGSSSYVGGVVAYSHYSTIINCYNIGDICSTSTSGGYVGGVAGGNSYSTIINSYNIGNVIGDGAYSSNVGGVAGNNYYGMITNCYNKGEINGFSSISGVTGGNSLGSSVINSYNMGKISGTKYIGGIAGANSFSITDCYNIGEISGNIYVGGVTGSNLDVITNCYRLSGCVDQETLTEGMECDYGLEVTNAEAKSILLLNALNAEQDPAPWVNDVSPNINSGYPILSWQVE